MVLKFPTLPPHKPSEAQYNNYLNDVKELKKWMSAYMNRLGFAPSARGWCYALEDQRVINKGDFKKVTDKIAAFRKSGLLPFHLVAEDSARELEGYDLFSREETGEQFLIERMKDVIKSSEDYRPISYWEYQRYFPIVMVEKIDLVGLFKPVLPSAVHIFNARGWADVNSRVALIKKIMWAEEQGLEPIILYCGDHDPAGLQISDTLKGDGQLGELSSTLGYTSLNSLRIIRFGLNLHQIEDAGLTWIDNLETSSGKDLASPKHPHHKLQYVQDYLSQYGARKVEANSLVAKPEYGRQIMADEIAKWLDQDAIDSWERDNEAASIRCKQQAACMTAWLGMLESSGLLFTPAAQIHGAEMRNALFNALPQGN